MSMVIQAKIAIVVLKIKRTLQARKTPLGGWDYRLALEEWCIEIGVLNGHFRLASVG